MGKALDSEKYWEIYWEFKRKADGAHISNGERKRNIFEKIFDYMDVNYHDYLLWDVIYKKYMPKTKGARVLEVGSAPGYHLVKLKQRFNIVPYGVENSKRGVEVNRKTFISHRLDPDNVIYADFFSDSFQNQYKGFFDIIISRGFIEDFGDSDAGYVVERHINLLANGGYLFAVIPNFRGINYLGLLLFGRELLKEVNFGIMKKEKFAGLFSERNMQTLFCGYYGTFNCGGRFSPRRDAIGLFILGLFNNLQKLLNIIFRVVLRDRGLESGLFSPYIVYVGVKNK